MRPPKGKRDWRVEFEDASGICQIGYPDSLERSRELVRLYQSDRLASYGMLRVRIYFRKKLIETWPLNPAS